MSIETNQQVIEAYFAVVGLNDHARYVRKQILNSGMELPKYYQEHGTLTNSGLKLTKVVLGKLDQLLSGELDPEQARQERMDRDQDALRLTGKVSGIRAGGSGMVRPKYDHKK
ncbi:MAG TPA: hypothetical protein VJJ52_06955 [Candidatus Nanoarchaeia archaeon]|nr:hypothetical protein [Candidatus Nanoarchaeia archaeon]